MLNYKIIFPADYRNVLPLRELAYNVAILQGFEPKRAEHLRSVVDELCNNAIEYGSKPASEVTLEIHADGQAIKITCQDQGQGNTLKAEDIEKLIAQEISKTGPRGRGIPMIVKSFVNEFRLENRPGGGIIATASIHKDTL